MACSFHPAVAEVTQCGRCRRNVCANCYVVFEGRNLCASCKASVVRSLERGQLASSGDRGPSPWEQGASFGSLVATAKRVFGEPASFFRGLNHQGNGHFSFMIAMAWLPIVVGQAFWMVIQAALLGQQDPAVAAAGFLGGLACVAAMIPLQLLIGTYVGGAIVHGFLRLFGGARAPLEASIRVLAYAQATQVVAFVPLLGGVVAAFWMLYIEVVGLREMHETSTAKVLAAVFLPAAVMVGLVIMAMVAAFVSRQ